MTVRSSAVIASPICRTSFSSFSRCARLWSMRSWASERSSSARGRPGAAPPFDSTFRMGTPNCPPGRDIGCGGAAPHPPRPAGGQGAGPAACPRAMPASDPSIDRATLGESEAVAALVRRFFVEEGFDLPEESLEARVRTYLEADGHAIFVARREGAILGVATVMTSYGLEYGWSAELEDLYVLPEERGKGLARGLVEGVAAW